MGQPVVHLEIMQKLQGYSDLFTEPDGRVAGPARVSAGGASR